jgi:hypothetical protein
MIVCKECEDTDKGYVVWTQCNKCKEYKKCRWY